jgi:hypothetical protein
MKKLFVAAMMVLSTSAAFAGDSDALKNILKAKTYQEAEALVKSAELANDAEKAAAWNKVAELARAIADAEIQKQYLQQPADEAALYDALSAAVTAAEESYKYDILPNEKGKVKPRFDKKNADALYPILSQLINGGGYYQGKDDAKAYKLLAQYVETAKSPLFDKVRLPEDPNLGTAAFFASYMALQSKEYVKAEQYAQMALNDPERGADAQKEQIAAMQGQLTNHADSVAYGEKLEAMLAKDPKNDVIFSTLCSHYSAMGEDAKADAILDQKIAADPTNYSALLMKGQIESQKKNYDVAAESLEKALGMAQDDDTRVAINAAIGECYFYKAQERVNSFNGVLSPAVREQFNIVYNKAIQYLEAARDLDVAKQQKRSWAYPLYGAYYFVKGADAPETQAAAADAGVVL